MKIQEMTSNDEYIGVQMSSLLFVRNLFSLPISISVEGLPGDSCPRKFDVLKTNIRLTC